MKNQNLKKQLDKLPVQMAEVNCRIVSFMKQVKRLPQGVERWELEEWIIAECHIDPKEIRTNPNWSKQDWIGRAINLKDIERRYRAAGKLAKGAECEAEAKIADERAAWMQ